MQPTLNRKAAIVQRKPTGLNLSKKNHFAMKLTVSLRVGKFQFTISFEIIKLKR